MHPFPHVRPWIQPPTPRQRLLCIQIKVHVCRSVSDTDHEVLCDTSPSLLAALVPRQDKRLKSDVLKLARSLRTTRSASVHTEHMTRRSWFQLAPNAVGLEQYTYPYIVQSATPQLGGSGWRFSAIMRAREQKHYSRSIHRTYTGACISCLVCEPPP